MKQCPQCGNTYTDDNQFCLQDGTVLTAAGQFGGENFYGETPTVFIPKTPPVFSPPPPASSVGKWVFPVLGLLIGVIFVLGFLLVYQKFSSRNENKAAVTESTGKTEANGTPETPEKKDSPKPASGAKETPAPTPSSTPPPTPPPPTPAPPVVPPSGPVVSRIRFNRGETTHGESGGIAGGGKRIFLLSCRFGQSLSASVSSDNNCVRFDNNSSSVGYITGAGDNRIIINNACEATRFRLSVTIR